MRLPAKMLIFFLALVAAVDASAGACAWDANELAFSGTPRAQAQCLLRPIAQAGDVSDAMIELPDALGSVVGEPIKLKVARVREHLRALGIAESEVGGDLDQPLSTTAGKHAYSAIYFVIHDTSFPYGCAQTQFPAVSDRPTDRWNTPQQYLSSDQAHLYITRDGQSYQPQGRTFQTPWTATQFEKSKGKDVVRGRFLHIENVQLRRPNVKKGAQVFDSDGQSCVNDQIAQEPGFTVKQSERLALAYIAASVRAKKWMIPVFHGVLDLGSGTHDDPQKFDLRAWSEQICALRDTLGDPCQVR